MPEKESLEILVRQYIDGLRVRKLEAFDKETAASLKKAPADEVPELKRARQSARADRAASFAPNAWLDDAARRAPQISLATHAIKFSHSDARGSNLYATIETPPPDRIGTHSLPSPTIDVAGNAAALDVANLLLLRDAGPALWQRINARDGEALRPFARDDAQLADWVAALAQTVAPGQFQTHALAKQVYWPVDDGYHLLAPIFATSLAHAIWTRIDLTRYGESAKQAREQRRHRRGCADDALSFPAVAAMSFGGTKPQNVSLLNSRRRGRAYLLSSRPPHWRDTLRAPANSRAFWRTLERQSRDEINALRLFIATAPPGSTEAVRRRRAALIDDIAAQFFQLVTLLRASQPPGWSRNSALGIAEQCLLDPDRGEDERAENGQISDFQRALDTQSWRDEIATLFGQWLNRRLSRIRRRDGTQVRELGDVELNEWRREVHGALSRVRNDLDLLVGPAGATATDPEQTA